MANGNGNGEARRNLSEEGKSYVERIENVEAEIDRETEEFKDTQIAPLKADVKEIYDEAKAAGFTKKALKAIVTARKKQRQIDKARAALDIADQSTYDQVRNALGDYADTALGKAALGESEEEHTTA